MKNFKWNARKNGLVNVELVRNIEIKRLESGLIEVMAWFNDRETLSLGRFTSKDEADEFINEDD